MAIAWIKRMSAAFGPSFMWLVIFVYFTQGFRSFVWTAVSYQMKDVLKLSPSASQFVVSVAYFPWSIKPLYGLAHIGLGVMNLMDIALVARSNTQLGIPDKYMVLGGSAFGDTINQFKLMPFLILSGQLCPPGIEGTLFALFMSINNLGNTLGSFSGAALASMLGISSGSYHNLIYGLLVQLICTLIPIGFLFLIPNEATGLKLNSH